MKLKNIKKILKKRLKFKKNKKVLGLILSFLFLLLITISLGLAFIFKDKFLSKNKVEVNILSPENLEEKRYLTTEFKLDFETWLGGKDDQQEHATALASIDDKEIFNQEIDLNSEKKLIEFSKDLNDFEEGEHQVQLKILDVKEKILFEKSWTFIKDTLTPQISPNSEFEIENSTAKINIATKSGQIKITDSKANQIKVKLNFTEAGKLNLEAVAGINFDWTKEETNNPEISLEAGQKPFSTAYVFTDKAGHELKGEFIYYYDNQPPTFKIISPLELTDKWGKSYALNFEPSEPVSNLKVTLNGQELYVGDHTFGYKATRSTSINLGDNAFVITATDLNGNTGSQTVVVKLTADPNPVYWAGNPKPFTPCTQELRNQCMQKVGYDFGSDCGKWHEYVNCLKPICDSTSSHNICGNSWE